MSGQWWESNLIVGPFSNITEANAWAAANPSSLFLGLLAIINGALYSRSGTAWVVAGNVLPTYETWGEAVTAAGTTKGWVGLVRRLCGNGYFHVMHNGTRLAVSPGESIIRDAGPASAGYDLTATGAAYVTLASYTIPAGLIGDGEEWEADCFALFTTFVSGNNIPSVRLAANVITSQNLAASANRTVRNRGAFPRLGTTLQIRNNAAADIYSGGTTDVSVDLGLDQTIDAGISMGAVGNVGRLRQWTFRRIG